MALKDKIRVRRDTTANFTSANPVLDVGEVSFDTTVKRFKVGDGSTAWTSLSYTDPNAMQLNVENQVLPNVFFSTWGGASLILGIYAGPSGFGRASLYGGSSSTTGNLSIFKPNGTRQGFIGSDSGNDFSYNNDQSGVHSFNRGVSANGNFVATGGLNAIENNSWIGLAGNNFLGGVSNFRPAVGGYATATINGETGVATFNGVVNIGTFTVATLPSASANAGAFAQVTNSNSTTNGSTVAGGGSSRVPVFSNGTDWIIK